VSLLACLCVVATSLSASACRTSYAFRVGDSADRDRRPGSFSKDARRFWSSAARAWNEGQRAVAKGMAAACAGQSCDFGLVVGDNIYPVGIASVADPQLSPKFHGPYDPLGLDLWLWPGNHDWYNKSTLQPAIEHTTHASNASGA
jgi:hypothetical protein